MRRHEAAHGLPVSNGWGMSSGGPPSVWCGYCRDTFVVDAEWVRRYYATRRDRVEQARARGRLTAGQHLDALQGIDADEAMLLRSLPEPSA